jgi:hypothetical protein
MFSFGVFYPPLAFLGYFSLAVDIVIVQIEIGRLISRKDMFEKDHYVGILKVLNNECHGLTSLIRRLAWAPGFFSTWIYTFILFDTMSDTLGVDNGFLIAFLWLCLALSLKGFKRAYNLYKKRFQSHGEDIATNSNPLGHRVAVEEQIVATTRKSAIMTAHMNPMQRAV